MEPETIEAYNRPRELYNQPEPTWRPSLKLPTFDGKAEEWESFWIQFQICARSCHLGNEEFPTHLLMSLKGSALSFATGLGYEVLQDAYQFSTALKSRYSYIVPAEIQRTGLHSLQKTSTETLHDYASRVQSAMQKAYPDIQEAETFRQLTVDQFLNGYPDQDLAYDVQTFNPKTMEEATYRLAWMESCVQLTRKRPLVRKTTVEEDNRKLEEESLVRKQYVTEERFLQFKINLHSSIQTMLEDFAEKYFRKRQEASIRVKNREEKVNSKKNYFNCKPTRCDQYTKSRL